MDWSRLGASAGVGGQHRQRRVRAAPRPRRGPGRGRSGAARRAPRPPGAASAARRPCRRRRGRRCRPGGPRHRPPGRRRGRPCRGPSPTALAAAAAWAAAAAPVPGSPGRVASVSAAVVVVASGLVAPCWAAPRWVDGGPAAGRRGRPCAAQGSGGGPDAPGGEAGGGAVLGGARRARRRIGADPCGCARAEVGGHRRRRRRRGHRRRGHRGRSAAQVEPIGRAMVLLRAVVDRARCRRARCTWDIAHGAIWRGEVAGRQRALVLVEGEAAQGVEVTGHAGGDLGGAGTPPTTWGADSRPGTDRAAATGWSTRHT